MRVLEGLLLLDKPAGPTSHDLVAGVRRLTLERRVGHAGTLDPMASGLLPMVLGRATRLVRFLPHEPKRYTGRIRLGIGTTTDDATGEVVYRHAGRLPRPEQVLDQASRFRGRLLQNPPAVSAKSVGGVRAYRLARSGRAVAPRPVPVEVFRFDLCPLDDLAEWEFAAEVSTGTYLRALARDLGQALGCGGLLSALRRTAIGPMEVSAALPWPQGPAPPLEAIREVVIPLSEMPFALPRARLRRPDEEERFLTGGEVPATEERAREGVWIVLSPAGEVLGVAEASDGRLKPIVVLGVKS